MSILVLREDLDPYARILLQSATASVDKYVSPALVASFAVELLGCRAIGKVSLCINIQPVGKR